MRTFLLTTARAAAVALTALAPVSAGAETISVPEGGNLQAAINAARPGDTILLAAGATYVGNFQLPVHGGTTYVTIRTGGADALLPPTGARISPAHAPYLAKLRSPNTLPALRTAPGAAFWRVMLVEFPATSNGKYDIVALGDGSSAQNSISVVPQHLILDRIYVHGDRLVGQKRGIALNSGETTIVNSYVSDIKAVAQDSQAIAGANGPGPYHIENNYLEAAGNVFLIGGDDPKIAGLVPADLMFRGNTVTRPVSWKDAIVPAPAGVTATAGAGGSLTAGTYAYRVVARRPAGTTTATSARSTEVAAIVAADGAVTVHWDAVPDATEYRVYGRTVGGQNLYWTVQATSFTDTGVGGTTGNAPSVGTVWQVKNLFELKNTRRAQIDYNLMENNWQQAQAGVAILFTVRNQYGGCFQCVVEDVTFEYNVVRNVAAGINILGIDPNYPSEQTNAIRIRHNEFSGLDRTAWGGNGYFLQLGNNPRDITIDHNTIISPNGLGIVTVTGAPVYGFVFTNNVARHNSYGIFGDGRGYGNAAMAYYFPDMVMRRNVLAGGKASLYPADNLFPTVTSFQDHFVDYPGKDYALVPGTDWENAGLDAEDLGADMAEVRAAQTGHSAQPPQIVTQLLPAATELEPYAANLEVSGGTAPYTWRILDGGLPPGIVLDPLTGALSGSATSAGDFVFSAEVADAHGATAAQPLMVRVDRAVPPVEILTAAVAPAVAELPYVQHLDAAGGLGTYVWTLVSGQLPSGLTLSPSGDLTGTPATPGTWDFMVAAQDAQDPQNQAVRAFVLPVAEPPNKAPQITLRSSANGVVQVGTPVILTADVSDGDGFVERVDFFVNGQAAGTASSAPFTLQWVARDGGPHTATARAFDDDGAETASDAVTIVATSEVVIYASDVVQMSGDFQMVADVTAAGGSRLWNPNRNVARVAVSAAPVSYAEFTFHAEAGRAYHIWLRGLAEKNNYNNDSFYVQFSDTVTAQGAATNRIGTTNALSVIIEDRSGASVQGWGWNDNAYAGFGAPIYFAQTGPQTLRIQQREDGLSIDQIVISPVQYFSTSPGLLKNDATIVAR